ncbi:chloramphenicol acetyltransferase [Taibaiella chishuiensis]|uniref:Chloramphenicol O-acetyltransferase type A n=1 Tax=Taibaiella chishuiensis TaxID=1434707 RepID=A0A2P8DDG2_9BACT|nr:chloramphenicol acetyltransferase [Taibaiella chishuiensis]PSK95260.1 chloramphenicol O-acetyltransferase type A [Taibaiella chishuiensis]
MKQIIDQATWVRRDHFAFFSRFEEPFFGVTIAIDCTEAYAYAKAEGYSFFLLYLYRALRAANSIPEFRYRIADDDVVLFDEVHASPTINRPDGSFGFAYMDYHKDETVFRAAAQSEVARVQQEAGLVPGTAGQDMIHFSAIPWLDFTALSHARSFSFRDSCPKISFGKMTEREGRKTMPVSVHGHHGLMDGYHIGLFADRFQQYMTRPAQL